VNGNTLLALFEFSKIDPIAVAHFLVALYLSISVHEAAHAWMADRCGDDTARLMGRMTLNPIVHIDPIGTVLVPAVQVLFSGVPLFGWAKPVPVNPLRFRNMRRGEVLVSLAGPASNFVLAVGALVLCWIVIAAGSSAGPSALRITRVLLLFLRRLLMLNIVLGIFNLIPIPPLDGSHILGIVLSREAASKMDRFLAPPYNFIIILFVVVPLLGPVFKFVFGVVWDLIYIWA